MTETPTWDQWHERIDRMRWKADQARLPAPDLADVPQLDPAVLAAQRETRWGRLVPARFRSAHLDDFAGRPFHADLAGWAESRDRANLVLIGPTGVGKTRAALAACRPGLMAGADLWFGLVAEALDELRPGAPDPAALGHLTDVGLLVLDDLGSERPTDWTAERLSILIDRRWRDRSPIVVTTNLELGDDGEMAQALGARAYSRIVGDDAVVLRMTGGDRRRVG